MYLSSLGSVRPCCPTDQNIFSAIFSNTCDWCTQGQINEETRLLGNENNKGNTTGVPNCDPNTPWLEAAFSNSCNLDNPIGSAVGLPQVPQTLWIAGLGVLAFLAIKR